MTITPLDLQVLFSKSVDYAENIARHSAAAEVVKTDEEKATAQQRNEATESIKKTEKYDAESNKIKEENSPKQQHPSSGSEGKQKESGQAKEETSAHDSHHALLEEGKGTIIDIID